MWLCLTFGCSYQPSPAEPARAPAGHHLLSNGGTYRVVFQPVPEAMPQNQMFELEVVVLDAADGTIPSEVELEVDAEMPAHRHGMVTEPEIAGGPGGRFLVTGVLLHMPGVWQLYFDVTRAGLTERAQVTVELE